MARTKLPIGQVLKGVREELGMSQEEVALRACVSRSLVASFESGARNPSLQTLDWLGNALHVRTSELLHRAERLQAEGKRTA